MLQSLFIQNFAIIDQLSVDFQDGMTVLSGETGAGKSIIIDALGIICGGRGSSDYIRYGEDRLMVEALFNIESSSEGIRRVLSDFGIEGSQDNSLLLHREINRKGTNLVRVNGHLANVSLLKSLGRFLVDIHGQHDHQTLLDDSQHIYLLDQFMPDHDLLDAYQDKYAIYDSKRTEWLSQQESESDQLQRLDYLKFQLEELSDFGLNADEEEDLKRTSRRMQNQAQVHQFNQALNNLLSEGEGSVIDHLSKAETILDDLILLKEEGYQSLRERLSSIHYELDDLAQDIAFKGNDLWEEDLDLDSIEGRLNDYSRLKRKYGMTVEELMAHQESLSLEIHRIQDRDHYLMQLKQDLLKSYQDAKDLADQLHQQRQEVSQILKDEIETQLKDLYMKESRFEVSFKEMDLDSRLADLGSLSQLNIMGYDKVSFNIATNLGQALNPLVKVASGGELSRFMLALKVVFAKADQAKVMVFDEIDTGVSGRVAAAIADKIHEVSNFHQVLCITHLPQVAAVADNQLYIRKINQDHKTATQLSYLDMDERVEIIAMMVSGQDISSAALEVSRDLLKTYHH